MMNNTARLPPTLPPRTRRGKPRDKCGGIAFVLVCGYMLWRQTVIGGFVSMDLSVLALSRLQFALTIMFHYLFPPLSIGPTGSSL